MTDDARFEDGAPHAPGTPALLATDPEDLAVISALVQDALLSADQIRYDHRRRRLALLLNRYCWEPRPDMARGEPARVRSLLVFGDVRQVRAQGIRQHDPDAILSRAEAALAKSDLVTTLAELDSLPEVARAAMADWRSTADQRLSAITALRELADTIGG